MGLSLLGSGVVWLLVTIMSGNWQAGLIIGLVVLGMCVSGMRSQADEGRQIVITQQDPERKGWW